MKDGQYGAENTQNYFVQLTDEETGNISEHSVRALATTAGKAWQAVLQEDKMTVIIDSTDGGTLEDTLGLKLNEDYKIQVRNIQDAKGNFADVQELGERLKDDVRPTVKVKNKDAEVTDGELVLEFSEPIKPGTATVYVDNNIVLAANLTDAVDNSEVSDHQVIKVDVGSTGLDLAGGKHTVSVIGAKDLNDNFVNPNPTTNMEFTVKAAGKAEKPAVESIEQIADNAFAITFTTKNVVPATGTVVTVKEGGYDSTSTPGNLVDITLAGSDVKATESGYHEIVSSTVDNKTVWTVVLEANNAGEASSTTKKLAYRDANVISKDIIVENFVNNNGTPADTSDDTAGDRDETAGKGFLMKKDALAPVVKEIKHEADTLKIEFEEPPFGNPNGKVTIGAGTSVLVKLVKDGVTYGETVTVGVGNLTDNVLSVKLTDPSMLLNGGLIPGASYSIELEDDVVKSVEEAWGMGTGKLQELLGTKSFVAPADPYTYTVPGTPVAGVPQTTKGLINSTEEILSTGNPYTASVNTAIGTSLKPNSIVIQIDGELDANTALDKGNYTLNDGPLPDKTKIEFFNSTNIDGVPGHDQYAVITLPAGHIAFTGYYSFNVKGLANKAGNVMIPVSDTVLLTDHVAPKAESVETVSSNTIKVTFDENVKFAGTPGQAYSNFKVLANGKALSVTNATVSGREVTLTLADNFDNAGDIDVPVTVDIVKDNNGQMYITDDVPAGYNYAANKAIEVTVSK